MFLTTVRVRRARPATLDHALTGKTFTEARESKTIVEVMCHGQAVAIVDVAPEAAKAAHAGVLWVHADLEVSAAVVRTLASNAVKLMAVANESGLTTREPATV